MKDEINDGGPAFPSDQAGQVGMSLRDWFAGQANQNDILRHQSIIERLNGHTYLPSIEECKYAYASEMLRARSANV